MKIEIYGIDESDFRCGGCLEAKRIFNACKLPFTFKKALTRNESGFPSYDLDVIDELQKRAHLPTRAITYPIIFVDDKIVRLKNLPTHLFELGVDCSEIE